MFNNEIDVEDETKEYICDEYPQEQFLFLRRVTAGAAL